MTRAVRPRATLLRADGVWQQAPLIDGALSETLCRQLADTNGRDHWVLRKGHVHEIGDDVAAELERDGYGKWLGDAPAPSATYPEPKPEPVAPRNVEAEIDELRGMVENLQVQVREILELLLRPTRKAS